MRIKTYNLRIPTRTLYNAHTLDVYSNQILVIPTKFVSVNEGMSYVVVQDMLIKRIVSFMKKQASKYNLKVVSVNKISELNKVIRLKNDAGVCFFIEFQCADKNFIASVYPVTPRYFHAIDITMYIDRTMEIASLVELLFGAVALVTPPKSHWAAYAEYYATFYKQFGFRKP